MPRALQEVTRLINERNEADFARKASQSGGSLTLVRPARRAQRHAAAAALARALNAAAARPAAQIRPPPDAAKQKAKSAPKAE